MPLLACLIVCAASLVGIMTRPTGLLAVFWPANAVFLGLLLRYPQFNKWPVWAAAILGYLAADTLTGSGLLKTSLLTTANLIGIVVAALLFSRLDRMAIRFVHPLSIVYFIGVLVIASVCVGAAGSIINPVLFDGSMTTGFLLWTITEFVNYVAVLPIILTLPTFKSIPEFSQNMRRMFLPKYRWVPAVFFITSLFAALFADLVIPHDKVTSPFLSYALIYPTPALILCALTYNVFVTTSLTLAFNIWAQVTSSLESVLSHAGVTTQTDLILFRFDIMLITLAPITIATVMAARQKSLDAEQAARSAAEEAMSARSLMMATMTHELRTPLNAIIGFSDMMSRESLGPLNNEKYLSYSKSINDAGNHLLALVNDLLSTAKAEAGEISLEPEPISSREVVDAAVRLVRGMAKDRGTSINVRESGWTFVNADPRAIKQVLLNLLSNALKFSDKDSTIEIGARRTGSRLAIYVTDQGRGMSSSELKLIGNPYKQAGDAKNKRLGTGLGLSLSRQLIEQHGGALDIRSQLNVGTTVEFDLEIVNTPA